MSDLPRITETWHWDEGNYAAGEAPYMGRSKFGKWVTVEHAAHIIVEYQQRLDKAEAEIDSRPKYGTSKCGHSERFLDWEDHSKLIKCTLCELKYLRDLNDALYKSQTAANQECEIAEDKLAAAEARVKSDYEQACYLRNCVAPECTPLDDTSGVLSQISNYIAGLRDDLSQAEGLLDCRAGKS